MTTLLAFGISNLHGSEVASSAFNAAGNTSVSEIKSPLAHLVQQ